MIVRIEAPRESLRCPACGSSYIDVVERFRRWWRTVPIGAKPVWIEMDVPRVECQSCHLRRRVDVTFAEPMWRHTRNYERNVIELLQFMMPQDVSLHLGTSWDLANDIQIRRSVFSLLEHQPLAERCTFIADENVHEIMALPHLSHTADSVLEEYEDRAD
jgi:transposase